MCIKTLCTGGQKKKKLCVAWGAAGANLIEKVSEYPSR